MRGRGRGGRFVATKLLALMWVQAVTNSCADSHPVWAVVVALLCHENFICV